MPRKVIWLSYCLTAVYWLGQAGGCATSGEDQNYKINEGSNKHQMFDTTHSPDKPGAMLPAHRTYLGDRLALARYEGKSEWIETTEAPAGDAPSATAPSTNATPVAESDPSLRGIDRSHWPRITVRPDSGAVTHGPHYFNDVNIGSKRAAVDPESDTDTQLQTAMAGEQAPWPNKDNVIAAPVQIGKFFVDLVALPVRAVVTDPCWRPTTSP